MKTPQQILNRLVGQVNPYSDDPEDVPMLLSWISQSATLAIKYDINETEVECVPAELELIIEHAAQALALLSAT